jgi:hypothetical protein
MDAPNEPMAPAAPATEPAAPSAAPTEPAAPSAAPTVPAAPATPRTSRRRSVLLGLIFVLACCSILISTVALWTHQVAFKTERFTALVETVVTDPAVIDPLSDRISNQVVDAIDLQARIAARLPDALQPLAGTITLAVRDGLDKRLQVVLADPRAQGALVTSLSITHEQVMRLLRDEAENVNVVDGYVTLDVFPIVGKVLAELQTAGIIPADVQLPDLSQPLEPGVLAQRLSSALGVTLPADFGTIQLMPADRLLAARTVVKAFDIVVIALIVLSVILIALTLWLARSRRRMVVYLALGIVVSFLLARVSIRGIEGALIDGIADQGIAGAVRAVADSTLADLRGLTTLILIATVIVGIAAYLWGRPAWVTSAASAAGGAAGRAGSAAAAAGSAGAAVAAQSRPDAAATKAAIRERRGWIERIGIAVIVLIVVWLAAGIEIALLATALLIGLELLLSAVGKDDDDGSPDAGAPDDATTVIPTPTPTT